MSKHETAIKMLECALEILREPDFVINPPVTETAHQDGASAEEIRFETDKPKS